MLDTQRSSTLRIRMPHKYSIGFRSGDMLGHSNTLTFCFSRKAVVCLERCYGSLECCNTAILPTFCREGTIFSFKLLQYTVESIIPSMNLISPVPAALVQPPYHDDTTALFDCRHNTVFLVLFIGSSPYTLYPIRSKPVDLCFIKPQDMLPVGRRFGLMCFSQLFESLFVYLLQ